MAGYRLYLVSGLTRRFEPALELDADEDQTAIVMANEMRVSRAAELWCGSRMVAGWHPDFVRETGSQNRSPWPEPRPGSRGEV